MKVLGMTVSRTVRVNTGNYEGTEHGTSMKAEVDDFDDPVAETINVARMVEGALLAQLVHSYRARGKKEMTAKRIARHHGLGLVET